MNETKIKKCLEALRRAESGRDGRWAMVAATHAGLLEEAKEAFNTLPYGEALYSVIDMCEDACAKGSS
jgi:predicted regulator of Ras-like GTPase activity (Roadblock/LC7/MglB family)